MRTTTTLDDDLYEVLEREAKVRGVSFKEMLNTTLRRGLAPKPKSSGPDVPRVVVRPFDGGLLPGIDPNRLNQLYDELEVESFLEKQALDARKK